MTTRAARIEFSDWVRPHYDLVWVTSAGGFVGFADIATGPVVVNLNDVEYTKIDASLAVDVPAADRERSVARRARRAVARFQPSVELEAMAHVLRSDGKARVSRGRLQRGRS